MTLPYDTISTASQSRTESLFTKCCCCIPLRLGCFILGYLNLVFNTYHTLALLTLATYIGITTHGFDHFDADGPRVVSDQVPDIESVERPFLNQVGVLLMVVLCANIAWLLINVACLVGLHKKSLGPIRVYIGFATVRLLLSLAGFVYLVMSCNAGTQTIIIHSMDLGLAAYFILVYYIYAVHLERELEEARAEPANDIAFVYPVKIDKEKLVL
ncbi:uncharacterized protein LOC125235982 [Leguminivora glycinivorella]|uniref:uncharacterized protein LOC125235982 n=1 Tax=Leguminivora glycinivorella TaxID=1035111 RepID=UPI00200CF301|nr:uncharacterized protein LOC125235982 [Leguminivora glycinivorella]